ncbi:MAG: hypothetical protein WBB15_09965 [Ornithinimicrobium sp.]
MTVERTIADLVEEVGDLSLVADALRDASLSRDLDVARLDELLRPLAERNGSKKDDGSALLEHLAKIAGIDVDTVARRIAADTSMGPRVTANFLGSLNAADLGEFMTPEVQKRMSSVLNSPHFDDLVKRSSVTGDATKKLNPEWDRSLMNSVALAPETLAALGKAQKAMRT